MASNKRMPPLNGEIDLSGELLQLLRELCMSEEHCDVTIVIDGTKIPAHRSILSIRSAYFQRLFSGSFVETTQAEIVLKVPLAAFEIVLKYIYTGRASLGSLDMDQIVELCWLAEQYDFQSLKKAISAHLASILSLENCAVILNAALLYSLEELQVKCREFMDINCRELLTHRTFSTMSQDLVCSLLARDTFYAPEIDIFQSIRKWHDEHPNADAKLLFAGIRWNIMSSEDLLHVLQSNFAEPKQVIEVMSATDKSRRARKKTSDEGLEDVNVASAKHNAVVISGNKPSALLDVDSETYDFSTKGYCCETSDYPITIKLGKLHFINHIRFLLRNDSSQEYSYDIKVSVDGKKYKEIVDHSQCFWRSWQDLYFPACVVQYIQLTGTYNDIQVFGLEAMYRRNIEFINGFIKPSCNVATLSKAHVIEGGGGNNMLNSDSEEFTCHDIGQGAIIVQLSQSYLIGSVGIRLGNSRFSCNQYSFYIETSTDKSKWTMAVDKRGEKLSGWQQFRFKSRAAIFIRIVGTQQDVNLICSYFECPSVCQEK